MRWFSHSLSFDGADIRSKDIFGCHDVFTGNGAVRKEVVGDNTEEVTRAWPADSDLQFSSLCGAPVVFICVSTFVSSYGIDQCGTMFLFHVVRVDIVEPFIRFDKVDVVTVRLHHDESVAFTTVIHDIKLLRHPLQRQDVGNAARVVPDLSVPRQVADLRRVPRAGIAVDLHGRVDGANVFK